MTAGFKTKKRCKGVHCVCSLFVVALFPPSFLCMRLDCLNIWFLTWLQGYGLEEGTDPCVFYTQLTKLLNLIALLGIVLLCGDLTLFFDLCSFFFSSFMIKCCEIEFFCGTMWHARQVSLYKWTPLKRKETHYNLMLLPGSFTECNWFSVDYYSVEEEFWGRTLTKSKLLSYQHSSALNKLVNA